jgi:hypothetical protein
MPSPPNRRFSLSKAPDADTVTPVSGESHSWREGVLRQSAPRKPVLAFEGSGRVALTFCRLSQRPCRGLGHDQAFGHGLRAADRRRVARAALRGGGAAGDDVVSAGGSVP